MGVLTLTLSCVGLWLRNRSLRGQRHAWLEQVSRLGLHAYPVWRAEGWGPLDVPLARQLLGIRHFIIPVQSQRDAVAIMELSPNPRIPLVINLADIVSTQQLSDIRERFNGAEIWIPHGLQFQADLDSYKARNAEPR
jgi:hypothetical protein